MWLLWMSIYVFLLLYMPRLLPFSSLHIVAVIAWIHILTHIGTYKSFFKVNIIKNVFYLTLIMIYLFFVMALNGQNFSTIVGELYSRLGAIAFEMIPAACYVVYKASKRRVEIIDLIIFAATIQGVISVIAFIVPSIQNFIISTMVRNGYSDGYLKMMSYRLYGASYSMLFGMPIVNSIIGVSAFYCGVLKDWKYIICAILITFSAVVNARVAFIVLIISLVYLLYELFRFRGAKSIMRVFKLLLYTSIIFVVGNWIFNYMSGSYERIVIGWVSGLQNTIALIFSEDNASSYYSYYHGDVRWQLPKEILFNVFGTGQRVIRGNLTYSSDIGYINDIWLGGFFYSTLIYLSVIRKTLHINSWLKKKNGFRLAGVILLIILIVVNIKGTIVGINEVMAFFSILYVASNKRRNLNIGEDSNCEI